MHLCELIAGVCRGLLSHCTSTASQRPGAALLKCLLRPLLHTCAHSTHLPRMQPFCVSKATLPASANTHLLLASWFQDVFKAADSPSSGWAELRHRMLANSCAQVLFAACCLVSMTIAPKRAGSESCHCFTETIPWQQDFLERNGLEVMMGLKVHVRPRGRWFALSGTVTRQRVTWPLMSSPGSVWAGLAWLF